MGIEDLYLLFQVLPSNGLDRSLHAPILVGLLFLTYFHERLGWTYAGIVVPGYLATVLIVAPWTGGLVVAEAIVAYGLAELIGRWIPQTDAWSTLFGRERFLLIILCALLVRLTLEASLLPWVVAQFDLRHSRELYSIGLVLVPLLANSFWNAGIRAALPRVALVTALTYLVVDFVLLRYSNFTVSRFQVANESVSLLFLETPHAYIILMVGAVLAARGNVQYGWDYNGILVPALLAVACYQPTKLVTTVIEALIVLYATKLVTSRGPLSKLLIVGSRRTLVAYVVGFVVKWVLGFVVLLVAPDVEMIDFFGFGYLLPTLLAVKMWNTDRVGSILMPTLQVAVTAFLVGNGLSIGLSLALPQVNDTERRTVATLTDHSVPFELMLADTAPAPESASVGWGQATPAQEALLVLKNVTAAPPLNGAIEHPVRRALSIQRRADGWWMITPRSIDPNADEIAPRLAFRVPAHRAAAWFVVAQTDRVADPTLVVAHALAERLNARGWLVRSRLAAQRELDDAFLREVLDTLGVERVLLVSSGAERSYLSTMGSLPSGLDVEGLGDTVGEPLQVRWRAAESGDHPLASAIQLVLPRATIEAAAARSWDAPAVQEWDSSPAREVRHRIEPLTEVRAGVYLAPPVEYLRLYGRGILPSFLALRNGGNPSPWERALAARLGLRMARVGDGAAWALFEPPGERRRGAATLLVRVVRGTQRDDPRATPLMVEVPAPRWEVGVVDAGLALFRGTQADALLMSGAMPSVAPHGAADVRRSTGMRSYYQHAHEVWLNHGGNSVVIQGIAPEQAIRHEAVVAFADPVTRPSDGPEWTRPLVQTLADSGLDVAAVDGSLPLEPYAADTNPAMSYARAFARDQVMVLWLSAELRHRLLAGVRELPTEQRLARLELPLHHVPVARRALELRRCFDQPRPRDCPPLTSQCQASLLVDSFASYSATANPYALRAGLASSGCHVEVARDLVSDRIWAMVLSPKRLFLVPLRTGRVERGRRPLERRDDLERALAMGLGVIEVGEAP